MATRSKPELAVPPFDHASDVEQEDAWREQSLAALSECGLDRTLRRVECQSYPCIGFLGLGDATVRQEGAACLELAFEFRNLTGGLVPSEVVCEDGETMSVDILFMVDPLSRSGAEFSGVDDSLGAMLHSQRLVGARVDEAARAISCAELRTVH